MNNLFNFEEDGFVSQPPPLKIQEVDCPRCGNRYRFAKSESMVDYKKAYEDYREMYRRLIHELNELMSYSEQNYSMNPAKDKLTIALLKLREKFEKDY
jgi:hypothetical protein